jgi:serine/threonine protein kinase
MPLQVYPRQDLTFGSQLGCGSFGEVFHCRLACKLSLDEVVVKFYHGEARVGDAQRLLGHLGKVDHPNLSKVFGLVALSDGIGLMLEPIQGPSLNESLYGLRSFTMVQRLQWIRDIISAVKHLHRNGIAHRDLKTENILFRDEFCKDLVITDYGMAPFYESFVRGWSFTKRYAAPEVQCALTANQKSDIFSLGLIMWQIITLKRLPEGSLPTLECVAELDHRILLSSCWSRDPQERPDVDQINDVFDS